MFEFHLPKGNQIHPFYYLRRYFKVCLLVIAVFIFSWASVGAQQVQLGPLLPNDLVISTDESIGQPASVAFDGSRYLVVWSRYTDLSFYYLDIYGQFVDLSGNLSGPPFMIAHEQLNEDVPVVAFNGTHYFVVWNRNVPQTIRGRTVATNGLMGPEVVLSSSSSQSNLPPGIASDGSGFLAVWGEYSHIVGQRISIDGAGNATLDGGNFLISPTTEYQTFPAVAFGGTKYLVTWTNDIYVNAFQYDIKGALVDPTGTVTGPIDISTAPSYQGTREAGIAFDGNNFLVVFDDNRDASGSATDIYGVRVSEAGVVLDGPPESGGILISTSPGFCTPHRPKVAPSETGWLVAWSCHRTRGARVSSSGVLLDPNGVDFYVTPSSQGDASIAFDGTNYLVTWFGFDSNNAKYAQLVGPVSTNDPPIAVNDNYSLDEDTTLAVAAPGVLDNDSDPNNDSIAAVLDVSTDNGNLALNSDGSFTYTPDVNFCGQDSFTYHANDGVADSNIAKTTLNVNCVNDPPLAEAGGIYSGNEEVSFTLDGGSASDPENDSLTINWSVDDPMACSFDDPASLNPNLTCASAGQYQVTLTVDDGQNNPVSDSAAVRIAETNPASLACTIVQVTNTIEGVNVEPSINADGTRIAFRSTSNLNGGNVDGSSEIFLFDTNTSSLTQLTNTTGYGGIMPMINADGTRIFFESINDLTGDNPDGNTEIFLFDTSNNTLSQITVTTGGFNEIGAVNADGTRIAYTSNTDPTGGNPDFNNEIFVLDTTSGNILQVTTTSAGSNSNPSINADGTRVAFSSIHDLTGDNSDGSSEIFLYDTTNNGLAQISNSVGSDSFEPSVNADGTRIAFLSDSDLTGGNPDGSTEVFLFDTNSTTTTQITDTPSGHSAPPSINADGTRIAFGSNNDLTGGNFDHSNEVFLFDTTSGVATQITYTTGGTNGASSINAAGTRIAFLSRSNLNGGNTDQNSEIYLAECRPRVNSAPIAIDDSVTVNEGETINVLDSGQNSILFNDSDPDNNNLVVTTTPVNGPSNGSLTLYADGTFSYTHNGSETINDSFVYEVCDTGTPSECATATVTITVNPVNDPPVAEAGGPYNGNEGVSVSLDGASASDPDDGLLTIHWDVDDPIICSFEDASALNPNMTCNDNGSFQVTLTVDDGENDPVSDSANVTINNIAPTLGAINVDLPLVPVNTVISASADFTDPGTLDTHTATWDWGDSTTTGTVTQGAGFGSVNDSYSYTAPGVYTIKLIVTDDDGEPSNESIYQYVVIYDPEGGYVTGGGWIQSPEGAYTPDPSLTGKATFGFVSRYKKGANVPTGNTEFQFHTAGMDFHSDTYDWLVVNQGGANAQFKGAGTINGDVDPNGNPYKFMLWAGDGSPDTFRIRIWWEDTDSTEHDVYDNSTNQPIDGGSIVIHK